MLLILQNLQYRLSTYCHLRLPTRPHQWRYYLNLVTSSECILLISSKLGHENSVETGAAQLGPYDSFERSALALRGSGQSGHK